MSLKNLTIVKQDKMMCGPAYLKIVLDHYGLKVSQTELKKRLRSNIILGTSVKDIILVSKEFGFEAVHKKDSSFDEVKSLLEKNIPIIISWFTPSKASHFSIIYNIDKDFVYLIDPEKGMKVKYGLNEFDKY